MSSPIIVSTTPLTIAAFNRNRDTIYLQNTGTNTVYVKKQIPGAASNLPTATNYDFLLPPFGVDMDVIPIQTAASFIAVAAAATSTVAVMETARTTIV